MGIIYVSPETDFSNKYKDFLFEMAFKRMDYKAKIDNIFPQIVENYCLVRYCTLVSQKQHKKHWSDELRGCLITAARFKLKNNDKPYMRTKVIDEILEENDFGEKETIKLTIYNKFLGEQIDVNGEIFKQVCSDFVNCKDTLIACIISRDISQIQSFIDNI